MQPPRDPVGPEALPPVAPRWLTASISGVLSAGVFLAPSLLKFLAPAPLLIAARRRGRETGLRAAAVGGLTAPVLAVVLGVFGLRSGLSGLPLILAYGLLVVGPALLLDQALTRTGDAKRSLEVASLSYLALLAVLFGVLGSGVEGGTVGLVGRSLTESLDSYMEVLEAQAGHSLEAARNWEFLERSRAKVEFWGLRLFPAVVACMVLIGFWVNVMYARLFIGGETKDDDLTIFRLPWVAMPLFMVTMAGVVLQIGPLGGLLPRIGWVYGSALAGMLFLGVLYTLQGVAVVNWWFFRLRMSPILRMVGVGAQVLLIPPAAAMFAGVGLTDAWFDLRKLDEQADVENGEEK